MRNSMLLGSIHRHSHITGLFENVLLKVAIQLMLGGIIFPRLEHLIVTLGYYFRTLP